MSLACEGQTLILACTRSCQRQTWFPRIFICAHVRLRDGLSVATSAPYTEVARNNGRRDASRVRDIIDTWMWRQQSWREPGGQVETPAKLLGGVAQW